MVLDEVIRATIDTRRQVCTAVSRPLTPPNGSIGTDYAVLTWAIRPSSPPTNLGDSSVDRSRARSTASLTAT